jgi:peptidoglycan-associated lipoprotein
VLFKLIQYLELVLQKGRKKKEIKEKLKKTGVFAMIFKLENILKYTLVLSATLVLAACATAPKETASPTTTTTTATTTPSDVEAEAEAEAEADSSSVSKPEVVDGVYVGTDTIEMLAVDVPDRVFFAYDSYSLTSLAQETLKKQAQWLKANGSVTISLEGHADERGTREYNLALGDRRANSAKDFLMTQGISASRITTISYGKERPVNSGSNEKAWAQNRRSVTVRTN